MPKSNTNISAKKRTATKPQKIAAKKNSEKTNIYNYFDKLVNGKLSKKEWLIPLSVIVLAILVFTIFVIQNTAKINYYKNAHFDISANQSEMSVYCDSLLEKNGELYCNTNAVAEGTYTYREDNVVKAGTSTAIMDNGKWKLPISRLQNIAKIFYANINLDKNSISKEASTTLTVQLDVNNFMNCNSADLFTPCYEQNFPNANRYDITITYTISDDDLARVIELNKQYKAQEAERALQKAKEERISNLESCKIPTSEWTEEEKFAHSSALVSCSNKEVAAQKESWNKTAPSSTATGILCKNRLEAEYPYGVKIHNISGMLANDAISADTRFYKVSVTIKTMFGTSFDAMMECKVSNASGTEKIVDFHVY